MYWQYNPSAHLPRDIFRLFIEVGGGPLKLVLVFRNRMPGYLFALWFCVALIGSGSAMAGEYSPAMNNQCGSGTDVAQGCDAVRSRVIVDATAYPWSAIGRLNFASIKIRMHCSGTLIGERLVLTAAHCLYNELRKKWIPASSINFVAGYQRGAYVGHSKAMRYVVSKSYNVTTRDYQYRPQEDWAIVVLRDPIGTRAGYLDWALLTEAGLEAALRSGARVIQAGYPAVRQHLISVNMECEDPVFSNGHALFFFKCATMKGDSGGPVLLLRNGKTTIISVFSGNRLEAGEATNVSVPIASFHQAIMDELASGRSLTELNGLMGLPGKPPSP